MLILHEFIKGDGTNYRSVSMPTNISKIYEKLTYNQYSFVYYINIIVYNIILIILQ